MTLSYWIGWSLAKLIGRSFFNLRIIGKENLVMPGGALVVSNHASFLDPPFIGAAFDESIYFLARKSLFNNPVFGAVIRSWNSIPVDQDRPDMTSLKIVIRSLREGKKVLVFPEGSRSYDENFLPGMPGVGLIVSKADVPVIPVRIFGSGAALPRGGSLHPAEITVVCGKPWHYDPQRYQGTGKELYQRISDDLMQQIGALNL
jgi:1-acyl-sn-glycerol-3-phosphate acyltransferase